MAADSLRIVREYTVEVPNDVTAECHYCHAPIHRFSHKAQEEWKKQDQSDGTVTRWRTGRVWCSIECERFDLLADALLTEREK